MEIKEEEKIVENIPAQTNNEQQAEEGVNATPVNEIPELNSSPNPVPEVSAGTAQNNVDGTIVTASGIEPISFNDAQQKYINDLVGKTRMETRERTFKYVYDRYGVAGENELDDMVGNAQRFDTLNEEYDAYKKEAVEKANQLQELAEQVALLQSGIKKENYDDIKFLLKGKGLEVNADTIKAELDAHPYWSTSHTEEVFVPKKEEEVSTIHKPQTFGNSNDTPQDDEKARAMKMFGL